MLKFFAVSTQSLAGFSSRISAFVALTKPRVVSLIVFTAVIGMFLATPGMVQPQILIAATLGIASRFSHWSRVLNQTTTAETKHFQSKQMGNREYVEVLVVPARVAGADCSRRCPARRW